MDFKDPKLHYFLKILFLILMGFIVFFKTDLISIAEYLDFRTLFYVIMVWPLMVAGLCMIALRFSILAQSPKTPFSPTFKAIYLSVGLNNVLPGRISELLKPTFLHDHLDLPFSVGLAAVLLERLSDLIILGLLVISSLSFSIFDQGQTFFVILLIASFLFIIILPRYDRHVINIFKKLPQKSIRTFIIEFINHASMFIHDKRFYKSMLFGVLAWLCTFISAVVFLNMAGSISLGFSGSLAFYLATIIGGSIAILPAGIGTYETAAVILLKNWGYGFEEAFALAVTFHFGQILLGLIGSLTIIMTDRIGIYSILTQLTEFKNTINK